MQEMYLILYPSPGNLKTNNTITPIQPPPAASAGLMMPTASPIMPISASVPDFGSVMHQNTPPELYPGQHQKPELYPGQFQKPELYPGQYQSTPSNVRKIRFVLIF